MLSELNKLFKLIWQKKKCCDLLFSFRISLFYCFVAFYLHYAAWCTV